MSLAKYRLTAQIIVTVSILSTTIACSKLTALENKSTVFSCVQGSGGWITVAQRGNETSREPIFNWQTTEFNQWTPEKRCHHVSEKLTKAVVDNGGRLTKLYLTFGKVDSGETVICVLNENQKDCDRQNLIFTLNKENAKNPSLVLAKITNFSQAKGTGNTISESGGITQLVPLETLVERNFEKNEGF